MWQSSMSVELKKARTGTSNPGIEVLQDIIGYTVVPLNISFTIDD